MNGSKQSDLQALSCLFVFHMFIGTVFQCPSVCSRRTEDSLQHSLHTVDPRALTRVSRLADKHLQPLSHLTAPLKFPQIFPPCSLRLTSDSRSSCLDYRRAGIQACTTTPRCVTSKFYLSHMAQNLHIAKPRSDLLGMEAYTRMVIVTALKPQKTRMKPLSPLSSQNSPPC